MTKLASHPAFKQIPPGSPTGHVDSANAAEVLKLGFDLTAREPSLRRQALRLVGAAGPASGPLVSDLIAGFQREDNSALRGLFEQTIRSIGTQAPHLSLATSFLGEATSVTPPNQVLLGRLVQVPGFLRAYTTPKVQLTIAEPFAEALGLIASRPITFFREVLGGLEFAAPCFCHPPHKQMLGELVFGVLRSLPQTGPHDFGLLDIQLAFRVLLKLNVEVWRIEAALALDRDHFLSATSRFARQLQDVFSAYLTTYTSRPNFSCGQAR